MLKNGKRKAGREGFCHYVSSTYNYKMYWHIVWHNSKPSVFSPYPVITAVIKLINSYQKSFMKKLFLVLFIPVLLIACTKQNITRPNVIAQETKVLAYEDANISLKDFKVEKNTKGEVAVQFVTTYEKNLKKIEVMRGSTENYLCSICEVNKKGNSEKYINYQFNTSMPASATSYYMIRYTLNNGDWGYTPLYKFQLQ